MIRRILEILVEPFKWPARFLLSEWQLLKAKIDEHKVSS